MASFQDAGWLRRLWSLASPGDPVAQYVQNVQVVNDRAYASSRERAPYLHHGGFLLPPAAGSHNYVELIGTDALAPPVNALHFARFECAMVSSLTGLVSVANVAGAALTTVSRTEQTPFIRDADPDVVPRLFLGTILSANLPASRVTLPRKNSIGQTGATPIFQSSVTELTPLGALPFAASWNGPNSLIFYGGDAEFLLFQVAYQAMRA